MRTLIIALFLAAECATAASGDPEFRFDPSRFDTSVDVCVDPYAYVNNRFLATTGIPPDRPMWGPRLQVVDRNQRMQKEVAERAAAAVAQGSAVGDALLVGTFFAAGLDERAVEAAGLRPVAADLARIDALRTRGELVALLADLSANGIHLAFSYYVWPKGDDPDRYGIYVEQGGLGMTSRESYLGDDEESKTLQQAYVDYLSGLLGLAGIEVADARRQAHAALAIETMLARASFSAAQMGEVRNLFAVRALPEVRTLAPHLGIDEFLRAHGHGSARDLSLAQPDFVRALDERIANAPIADWRAYLRTRLLDRMAPHLGSAFVERHFAFHGTAERGIPARPARWKQVLQALSEGPIHSAMGRLYVDAYLDPGAKPAALAMVSDVRAAFRARIERAAWMGESTRRAALGKIDRMVAKIGYPDRWPDLSALVLDASDHAGNQRAAWRFAQRRDDARLDLPVDRGEWRTPAYEVNARYQPQANEIIFPAPVLQAPVFDPAFDPALNYATLGMLVAHEMTHGFDPSGAQFDARGALREGWTAQDRRRFDALVARVERHYSAIEVAPGKHVDGKLTAGENIADLGGLAIAHDALVRRLSRDPVGSLDGWSQDQRFFLRFAWAWAMRVRPEFADLLLRVDTHAPDRFRALVPLSDLPAFAQAFACGKDAPMGRGARERIGIW